MGKDGQSIDKTLAESPRGDHVRCLQEAENKVQWGWLFAPSCSCHNFTRKRAASFTYIRRRPFYEQPGERQKHARGTCRQHGNARVTKGKTLEGNGANSADKLVANMASFLSPAAKVNTEQRPSKTATKAAKAPGKICLSDFFKSPSKGQVSAGKAVSSAVLYPASCTRPPSAGASKADGFGFERQ